MAAHERELTRTLLGVISLGALIVASFWILRPFLAAAIWAAMISVATWPAMLWLQARLWRRRSLAVAGMTVILLLVFVVPLALAIGTIVLNADASFCSSRRSPTFVCRRRQLGSRPSRSSVQRLSWRGNRRPLPVWTA
jgi:predicted PurR-regulated permease PerM